MQKSFVAFALAVFSLSAVSDAAAQDAPQQSLEAIRLPESRALLNASAQTPARLRAQRYLAPDPVKDGLIKGAVAGLIFAALINRDLDGNGEDLGARDWAAMIAMGAGYGLVIDFLHPSRQPGARPGPQSPGIAAKVKLRF